MTKEIAQMKFAEWANISEDILMFVKEVKDSFHFIYRRDNRYFKIAIAKSDDRFYSISNSLSRKEIEKYDKEFLNLNKGVDNA